MTTIRAGMLFRSSQFSIVRLSAYARIVPTISSVTMPRTTMMAVVPWISVRSQ